VESKLDVPGVPGFVFSGLAYLGDSHGIRGTQFINISYSVELKCGYPG
jgi:hypothetical protein